MSMIRASFLILLCALCSAQSGAAASAQDSSAKTVEQKSEFEKAFDDARVLAAQGRLEDAISGYRKAAKMQDDKCAPCFQMIGHASLQLGKLKESAAAFRQAAELKPANEADLYNILGVVLYLENEKEAFGQAAVALQRAIDLSGGKIVMAYYNLGFALIKSGKEQQGTEALKKFLELAPGAAEAVQARAVIGNPKMVDARIATSFAVKSSTTPGAWNHSSGSSSIVCARSPRIVEL